MGARRRLFIDVETTGTDPKKHSIIELAAILEVDGEIWNFFHSNIRPHPKAEITSGALAVNGHDDLGIWGYPPASEVLSDFKLFLEKGVNKYDPKDKIHLLGYNNRSFDDQFLRMMFTLEGDKFFGSYFWPDSVDVLCLASDELMDERDKLTNFRLGTVAKYLGIDVEKENLHNALYDAGLTREVYWKLKSHAWIGSPEYD